MVGPSASEQALIADDRDLVERVKGGDASAYDALVQRAQAGLDSVLTPAQRARLQSLRAREAFGARENFGGREMRGPPPPFP